MKHFIAIVLLLPHLILGQYSITGRFSPPDDYKVVLLYKSNPTVSKYINSAEIHSDGSFKFELDSTVTRGIYKIVYAVPQEDYNFDVIYSGKEDIELTFNPETGVSFLKSFENKLLSSYANSMSRITQSIGEYYRKGSKDTTALRAIFKIQRETQDSFEKAAKGTIALDLIKANKPYIPKTYVDLKAYLNLLKTHYFDAIDFSNKTLQSSSLMEAKMLNYVFGMTASTEDETKAYIENTDALWQAMASASLEVKRILLVDLWQQMVDLNKEDVANYIGESYLMDIAVSLNDQRLLNGLIVFKDTSLGNEAPDFSFNVTKESKTGNRNLSELKGYKNYIIVFWSSNCSHCLDEIPKLHDFYKTFQKDSVKIIAVALEDDNSPWEDLIVDYPEFINIYGKGKWENTIAKRYGVRSTPTYYVLDKDKRIVSKPEHFDALEEWFSTD